MEPPPTTASKTGSNVCAGAMKSPIAWPNCEPTHAPRGREAVRARSKARTPRQSGSKAHRRNLHHEARPAAEPRFIPELAATVLGDSPAEMEPQPGSLTFHSRGEERVENSVHDVGWHAQAIVRDSYGDLIIRLADVDPDVLYA